MPATRTHEPDLTAPKVVPSSSPNPPRSSPPKPRKIAGEHGIPILERPPLARAQGRTVEVGQEIPEEYYSAVAEILAYVYEISGKARRREMQTV